MYLYVYKFIPIAIPINIIYTYIHNIIHNIICTYIYQQFPARFGRCNFILVHVSIQKCNSSKSIRTNMYKYVCRHYCE